MSYGFRPRTSQRPVGTDNARRFLRRVESEMNELVTHAPGGPGSDTISKAEIKQVLDTLFIRHWGEPRTPGVPGTSGGQSNG